MGAIPLEPCIGGVLIFSFLDESTGSLTILLSGTFGTTFDLLFFESLDNLLLVNGLVFDGAGLNVKFGLITYGLIH